MLTRIILTSSLFLALPLSPQETVQRFPNGIVRENMIKAQNNFNREFGDYARIVKIAYAGTVGDPARTVDAMLKTGLVVETGSGEGRPSIVQLDPGKLSRDEQFYLRDSLLRNVAPEDTVIEITVKDQKSGATFASVNSMAMDGNRLSGVFLGTTRARGGFTTSMRRPNTVCKEIVISTYLWGSPAETVEGCVRARCEGERCVDCVVMKSDGFPGFFGDVKIVPNAGTPGRINSKCCEAFFNYTWVTGFKSVKIGVDKVSLQVEGRLGQSGNGSFTATECCDKPNLAGGENAGGNNDAQADSNEVGECPLPRGE